ncbi:MAG: LamG domain-containing protein, partial [Planctomycetes bacterium]|nr:LamG domain-containing protein [Planctomycetota bacterium]
MTRLLPLTAILLAVLPSAVFAADLRPDVLVYAPFDGDLRCWLGSGLVETADFSRPTLATMPDLKRVGEDEPRYVSGRFGRAIYLEPGGTDLARGVRNILLSSQADPEAETSGFEAIQGAQLALVAPGLVGQKSLKVAATGAGSGFATTAIAAPRVMRYIGSAYLRGAKGGERVRLALVDRAAGVESDAKDVTLTTAWQRAFCVLEVAERDQTFRGKKLESLPALQLVITSADSGPSAFFADALMVEQSGIFYVNAQSPTSWLPGLHARGHERLSLPLNGSTFNPDEGTVAFWARPDDFLGARSFFSVGTNHFFPWGVNIGQKGLGFGARDAYQFIPKWHALGLQPEQWTHVALTWTKERVRLFLNGKPVGDGPCNNESPAGAPRPYGGKFDPQRLKTEHVTIGVGGYAHPGWTPNQFAKAALDEFLILRRELAPEDVAALAASQSPLGLVSPLAIELTLPVRVLGRELGTFPLPVQVTNLSPKPLADVRAALSIPSHPTIQSSLPRLNPNEPQSLS